MKMKNRNEEKKKKIKLIKKLVLRKREKNTLLIKKLRNWKIYCYVFEFEMIFLFL